MPVPLVMSSVAMTSSLTMRAARRFFLGLHPQPCTSDGMAIASYEETVNELVCRMRHEMGYRLV